MDYIEVTPSAPLSGLVECYWFLRAGAVAGTADPERVLPDAARS